MVHPLAWPTQLLGSPDSPHRAGRVNVWLQSRSLPARGRVGLEVHRCLCIISLTNNTVALQAKYHTSTQARSIVHSFVTFCANTFDPKQWRPKPTLLSQRPQHQTSSISRWMILIQNIPNLLSYELCHLPGNKHAHPPVTTPTQQNEPPPTNAPACHPPNSGYMKPPGH